MPSFRITEEDDEDYEEEDIDVVPSKIFAR